MANTDSTGVLPKRLSNMRKEALVELAREHGLDESGTRHDLIARIRGINLSGESPGVEDQAETFEQPSDRDEDDAAEVKDEEYEHVESADIPIGQQTPIASTPGAQFASEQDASPFTVRQRRKQEKLDGVKTQSKPNFKAPPARQHRGAADELTLSENRESPISAAVTSASSLHLPVGVSSTSTATPSANDATSTSFAAIMSNTGHPSVDPASPFVVSAATQESSLYPSIQSPYKGKLPAPPVAAPVSSPQQEATAATSTASTTTIISRIRRIFSDAHALVILLLFTEAITLTANVYPDVVSTLASEKFATAADAGVKFGLILSALQPLYGWFALFAALPFTTGVIIRPDLKNPNAAPKCPMHQFGLLGFGLGRLVAIYFAIGKYFPASASSSPRSGTIHQLADSVSTHLPIELILFTSQVTVVLAIHAAAAAAAAAATGST
ncbi:hypothetical protein GQ42DRAFT_159816 [Ramicandelaber brevisporus]|nr:hypothetical protein GQ42DRAFT_159816 [Ramicandelaber brevisporus]